MGLSASPVERESS